MQEEKKEERPPVPFPEFVSRSFECLFNQNFELHSSLNSILQEKFKKIDERLQLLEDNLKEGFLFYTREIMKGLDDANEVLLHTLTPIQDV